MYKQWKENEIDYLRDNYGIISLSELADYFGTTINSVKRCAERHNIKSARAWTDEEIIFLQKHYKDMTYKELSSYLQRSKSAIDLKINRLGLIKSKYTYNKDFFENIDTEEKAYWLGFMFADGYIVNNENRYGEDEFGLTLAEDSLDSIKKFKKSLRATNPIRYDKSKEKGQTSVKLVLRSQKTVNDLIDKGCVKQKSLILQPPKKVPEKLLSHFIRGFFDGDGSLMKYNYNNYTSYQIEFTTTYEMAIWLREIFGKGDVRKEKRRDFTWYYSIGGNRQVLDICHYMYDEATIWMDKKYARYQELLAKYNES